MKIKTMRIIICIWIYLICLSNQIFAQKEESAIKSLSNCVAFLNDTKVETIKIDGKTFEIWLKEPNGNFAIPKNYSITGTAFFVSDTLSNYLVTAEHVAKEMTFNSDIVIHGQSDKPIIYKLKDISYRKDSLKWTLNKDADVATLLLDNNSIIFQNSFFNLLPIQVIEVNRIPIREREVTTIGFPLGLGYVNYFSPISKVSKPSSGLIELPRFDNNKVSAFFLLDDPSISGFSGSPVFELPAQLVVGEDQVFVTGYRLMGLVHGSINDKTGGGFAAIVPSNYIIKTIKESPKYSGIVRCYHSNGKLWSERIVKDGRQWIVKNNFDKNGNSVEKGSLNNGIGTIYIYDEDGKLLFVENYLNGILKKIEKQ